MLRRASLAFVLSILAFVTAASAQPPAHTSLLHHHRLFHGREVHQVAVLLTLQPPAEGWSTSEELRDAQVQAAVDWMISHGYFTDDPTVTIDFVSGPDGNSLVIDGPGIHIVIHLPSGPFNPTQREQLMAATAIRILPQVSNGF